MYVSMAAPEAELDAPAAAAMISGYRANNGLTAVTIDPDMSRNQDQYGAFSEMAGAAGMAASIEFMPGLPIGNLAAAVAVISQVRRPNFRLLIDCMHLMRSGGSAAELAALDPAMIGHIQLCDAPLKADMTRYSMEAKCEWCLEPANCRWLTSSEACPVM